MIILRIITRLKERVVIRSWRIVSAMLVTVLNVAGCFIMELIGVRSIGLGGGGLVEY